MEQHRDVGLASPKVLFPNGDLQPLCKLLPTPWDLIARRFFFRCRWVKARNERYELIHSGYNREMEIPNLSGCFMFFRADVLKTIGGFDERFFLYFEDIDLVRRAQRVASTRFLPQFQIFHHYGKASYRNLNLLKIHVISAIHYFVKCGWILDRERSRINQQTLETLSSMENSLGPV